ncbi:Hypothetical protein FKW44_010936 [Caligus rogercresseyi]|uniref:Uncharacterized protein n=1 Tax=Caligus rogercresseyi TaxID=217165 RepID=A0A7T8K8F6_CALRO|nr:Hypothetical protein FKW44_010936 [Caligus rogercresseyi]
MEMMASPNVSNNNYKGLGGPDSVTFRMKQHPNEDPNQTKKRRSWMNFSFRPLRTNAFDHQELLQTQKCTDIIPE